MCHACNASVAKTNPIQCVENRIERILFHFIKYLFTDLKYVDTRTFTRPKKRLFTFPEGNSTITYAENRERSSSDELVSLKHFFRN